MSSAFRRKNRGTWDKTTVATTKLENNSNNSSSSASPHHDQHYSHQQNHPNSSSSSSSFSSSSLTTTPSFATLQGVRPWWQGGTYLTSVGLHELDTILGGGQPLGTALLLEEDRFMYDLARSLTKYWCAEVRI
jgi:hypothetical protein